MDGNRLRYTPAHARMMLGGLQHSRPGAAMPHRHSCMRQSACMRNRTLCAAINPGGRPRKVSSDAVAEASPGAKTAASAAQPNSATNAQEAEWWQKQWGGPAGKAAPAGQRGQPGRGKQQRESFARGSSPGRRPPPAQAGGTGTAVRRAAPPLSAAGVGGDDADDVIVIGRVNASSYHQSLEGLQGGAYWEQALGAVGGTGGDSDDEEYDEEGEAEDGGVPGLVMDEAAAEAALAAQLVAVGAGSAETDPLELLRDLLPDLDCEGGAGSGTSASTTQHAMWSRVYTSSELPRAMVGAVRAEHVPGRGRGVVTTTAVNAGDTLLVALPLAVAYCEEGSTPENEELAERMGANVHWAAQQRELLSLLAPRGVSGETLPLVPLERLAQLSSASDGNASPAADLASTTGAIMGAAATAADQEDRGPLALDHQQLCEIVNANVLGEAFEDPVLCALRGTASCGHVGLWPAAAMLNHSCSPNALAYAIGDRLVVRAAQDLPAGREVTLSYLVGCDANAPGTTQGQNLLGPLEERQEELRDTYGFMCTCERCTAEAALAGSPVAEAQRAALAACSQPGLEVLLEALVDGQGGVAPRAAKAHQQLAALQDALQDAMYAAQLEQGWIKASTWPLYDALSILASYLAEAAAAASPRQRAHSGRSRPGRPSPAGRASGTARAAAQRTSQEAAGRLEECAGVLSAVAFGSSTHCDVAAELLMTAEGRTGRSGHARDDYDEDPAVEFAQLQADAAHAARYGGSAVVARSMLQLLIDTRAGMLGGLA